MSKRKSSPGRRPLPRPGELSLGDWLEVLTPAQLWKIVLILIALSGFVAKIAFELGRWWR